MPTIFTLDITTNPAQEWAELKLYDGDQRFLASNQVRLPDHPASQWEGLFDTRAHVERFANNVLFENSDKPATQQDLLTSLGTFLGEKVLGDDIMTKLSGRRHRTLLIRIPDAQDDLLAAAFARVPWEMARLETDKKTLFERNLVVRAIAANISVIDEEEESNPVVRVLLILAEAPQSNPLAARLERERLLELFEHEILPHRQVEVDFLCHGVTRKSIEEQVKKRGGYDIVHWSGHGHHNALELVTADGQPDLISGEELVELFENAGGFIPHLIFLSACHSGSFIQVEDWETLKSVLDNQSGTKETTLKTDPKLQKILEERKGYTGTAIELLEAEVAQVVAMRYAVGDAYSRRLARRFYQHLLADPEHHSADTSLALARKELFRDERGEEHPAIDHATPLLFGKKRLSFQTNDGRSSQLDKWKPQSQPLLAGSSDLDPPWGFVGRSEELTRLSLEWLPRHRDKSPLAVIQGMPGLGKTSLAAEVINIWHTRFKWVFGFQSRPDPITAEIFYQQLDEKLNRDSSVYRHYCKKNPNDRVYLKTTDYSGEQRYQHMRNNVLRALSAESILLILDNFETNLNDNPDETGYRCKDPEWENLLQALNSLTNTGSRILITTRHLPAILKNQTLWIPLGPLPMSSQVQLFLQGHDALRGLWYSGDTKNKKLVLRVFEVSRGHPLILQRLGNLATDLTALEKVLNETDTKGYQHLPNVFSRAENDQERQDEQRYLEDVIQGAIDELIKRVSPNARRLLWVVTLASESVPWFILDNVWKTTWLGEDFSKQKPQHLETLRELVDKMSLKPRQETLPLFETQDKFMVPEDLLDKLPEITPKIRKQLEEEGHIIGVPSLGPLLKELIEAGLLQQKGKLEEADYSFHELVKERCAAWVEEHPNDFDELGKKEAGMSYLSRNLKKKLVI